MGFQSQAGHVGFRTQLTRGAYRSPGTGGVFMRTRSGALSATRDLLIPDPEIGGGRDVSDAYLGPVAYAGEYDFYSRMEALATLFQAALGPANSSVAGAGPTQIGTHVIEPTDGELPWMSLEEKIANDFEHWFYTDAKANTLHLEADATGYLTGTVGLVALTGQAVPGASMTANPDWDTTPMIVGSNVTVEFDDLELPGKSFSFDLNNNLEDDDFRLGSLTLGDATEKRREFTVGVTQRPDSSDMWRQAVLGDPAAVTPQGTVVKENVRILCETYEFIGSTSTVYSLEILVPHAVIEPFSLTPSGEDAIEHDSVIRFLRPDPNDPICTVTLKNGLAAVA